MAELEQTSVEVQCSDGTFLNILLDATMAEQLRNGQIFLTEENGQIGIQQQDGQICLLEYADQTDVAVENTGKSFSEALILTHNMTKDCSLIYQFSTCKLQAQNVGRTCSVHKLF